MFSLLTTPISALSKPIAGYVIQNDSSPAQNATVIVYVNTTFGAVNPCYTLPSVYSGADGSYSTNLNNLKRADNGADCSGLWATNDAIWAEANGSTVIPTVQGNGDSGIDNVSAGTGLQYLDNITLAYLDNTVPIITLISPADANVNTTGNVVFEYNVTDQSSIANCSLIFNGTINETESSITRNITQNFTKIALLNSIYNWSINCTDTSNNQNTSTFRTLNVSKTGNLQTSLVTPSGDTNVIKNQFFEFTIQVNCLNGNCGDVIASLDPIPAQGGNKDRQNINLNGIYDKERGSFFNLILTSLKRFFRGNMITGLATGVLVPTTPTNPFWTNTSNPINSTNVSCLGNMLENSACNVTWWVNASGNMGNVSEFYAYVNSSTYPTLYNETVHINITISDITNPYVINVTATPSVINQTQTTNITANITDNFQLANATVNITYPNSSVINYPMTQNGGNIWYYEFIPTINDPPGTYTARIIANDTSGNVNNTETTTFNVSDITAPTRSNNKTSPVSPTNYSSTATYQFNVTWQDNVAIGTVLIEHNFTGTLSNYSVSGNVSNEYYYNYSSSLAVGTYIWRMYANDSSGNLNQTDQWTYTVTQASGLIYLYLNSSRANFTTTNGTYVNISTTLVNGTGNLQVYNNGTLIYSGSSPSENITQFNTTGIYNITATYLGNQNYTSSTETWWVNVINVTVDNSPNVTLVSPTATYSQESATAVNLTFICNTTDDNQLQNISLYITNSNNLNFTLNQTINITGTSNSSNWSIVLNLGSYTWNCLAFDNNSQSSFASANRTITLSAPAPSQPPGGGGGGGGGAVVTPTNVTCDYQSTCDAWDPSNCKINEDGKIKGKEFRYCEITNTECEVSEIYGEQDCSACIPQWNCTEWSPGECVEPDGSKLSRTCTDLNNCNTLYNKPNETYQCPLNVEIGVEFSEGVLIKVVGSTLGVLKEYLPWILLVLVIILSLILLLLFWKRKKPVVAKKGCLTCMEVEKYLSCTALRVKPGVHVIVSTNVSVDCKNNAKIKTRIYSPKDPDEILAYNERKIRKVVKGKELCNDKEIGKQDPPCDFRNGPCKKTGLTEYEPKSNKFLRDDLHRLREKRAFLKKAKINYSAVERMIKRKERLAKLKREK